MNASTQELQNVQITPPDFGTLRLLCIGTAPLVVERFAAREALMRKMAEGGAAKNKRERKPRDYEAEAQNAKHVSSDGWEGFPAAAFRNASISACRVVGFKMTLAKLSIFTVADGISKEDGMPLVRVYGKAQTVSHHTRNATGVVDVRSRPMYREWAIALRIRFDRQQFSAADIINLVARAGEQVGIGAGRPDSKSSAGMGWGTFRICPTDDEKSIAKKFGIAAA